LEDISIDSIGDTVDSPLGSIEYAISNIEIGVDLEKHPPIVDVDLKAGSISITVKKVVAETPEFHWNYEQLSFPHVKGEGSANATLTDCEFFLNFTIVANYGNKNQLPSLKVDHLDVNIQHFSLSVSSDKANWFYNILTKIFSSKIKKLVQTQIVQALQSSVTVLTGHINELGLRLALE